MEKSRFLSYISNLKKNWYFPLSAAAFFCLELRISLEFIISLMLAFVIMSAAACRKENIWSLHTTSPLWIRLLSLVSAFAICLRYQGHSLAAWQHSSVISVLEGKLPLSLDLPLCISLANAAAAFVFVYICLLYFWTRFVKLISDHEILSGITKVELIIYGLFALLLIAGSSLAFLRTDAFYGTEFYGDVIYTCDSPALLECDVFLSLTYMENDIRQPLFALFSAPFTAIPYLLGRLSGSLTMKAIFTNFAQILMLVFASFVLSKAVADSAAKRICFMLISFCSYTYMLASLMIEQYVTAYFWLSLCVYIICRNRRAESISMFGAGGTLITGMILLPAMSGKSPLKDFRGWFADMLHYGIGFVLLMLAFGRFDVFYNAVDSVVSLSEYAGGSVGFGQRLLQYIAFVGDCFASPSAGAALNRLGNISWQLEPVAALSIAGCAVFLLCITSAFINKDKIISRLALYWIGLSLLMLLVLGWGTMENGLVLYTLYFGWAFISLLFQLAQWFADKLGLKLLLPALSILAAIVLLLINIPAIIEMVGFGIKHYPL